MGICNMKHQIRLWQILLITIGLIIVSYGVLPPVMRFFASWPCIQKMLLSDSNDESKYTITIAQPSSTTGDQEPDVDSEYIITITSPTDPVESVLQIWETTSVPMIASFVIPIAALLISYIEISMMKKSEDNKIKDDKKNLVYSLCRVNSEVNVSDIVDFTQYSVESSNAQTDFVNSMICTFAFPENAQEVLYGKGVQIDKVEAVFLEESEKHEKTTIPWTYTSRAIKQYHNSIAFSLEISDPDQVNKATLFVSPNANRNDMLCRLRIRLFIDDVRWENMVVATVELTLKQFYADRKLTYKVQSIDNCRIER